MAKAKTGNNVRYKADYVAHVVDEFGEVNAERKRLEKREKELKKTLLHIREVEGMTTYMRGNKYEAHIQLGYQTYLPKDAVVLKLGEKWVEENSAQREFVKVTPQPVGAQSDK